MNLPIEIPSHRDIGNAGAVGIGVPGAAPAQTFTVGSVQFSNAQLPADVADEVMEQMADSIVDLTHQLEEANARIAVLEEEQKILAHRAIVARHKAKAAVTEGVEQQNLPAGVSRKGCHERPEPSPHFIDTPKTHESDTPETCEAVERWQQGKINIFDEMARLERERDEARIQYRSTEALGMALVKTIGEMKAERVDDRLKLADWRDCSKRLAAAVEHYHPDLRDETEGGWSEERAAIALFDELECQHQVKRDEACREKCRDKAAADGGWANI